MSKSKFFPNLFKGTLSTAVIFGAGTAMAGGYCQEIFEIRSDFTFSSQNSLIHEYEGLTNTKEQLEFIRNVGQRLDLEVTELLIMVVAEQSKGSEVESLARELLSAPRTTGQVGPSIGEMRMQNPEIYRLAAEAITTRKTTSDGYGEMIRILSSVPNDVSLIVTALENVGKATLVIQQRLEKLSADEKYQISWMQQPLLQLRADIEAKIVEGAANRIRHKDFLSSDRIFDTDSYIQALGKTRHPDSVQILRSALAKIQDGMSPSNTKAETARMVRILKSIRSSSAELSRSIRSAPIEWFVSGYRQTRDLRGNLSSRLARAIYMVNDLQSITAQFELGNVTETAGKVLKTLGDDSP